MTRMRADLMLVARGLAESRAKARAAIEAGGVTADGALVSKPSDLLDESVVLAAAPAHPWVSRAGVKLAHALDVFGVDPRGRICLDIGASTGGFSQVLLTRGARKVYAVDVGHGQMHAAVAGQERLVNLERTDARALTRTHAPEPASLIVCDVSFIGAAKALVAPLALAGDEADLIALIKPQFEAGPGKGGVLSEAAARAIARGAIAALDGLQGFAVIAETDSPIRGGDGNLEVLIHARRKKSAPAL